MFRAEKLNLLDVPWTRYGQQVDGVGEHDIGGPRAPGKASEVAAGLGLEREQLGQHAAERFRRISTIVILGACAVEAPDARLCRRQKWTISGRRTQKGWIVRRGGTSYGLGCINKWLASLRPDERLFHEGPKIF
jgi:hypothetical protein